MRVIEIIQQLQDYLNHPVILSNQAAPRPPYPYIAVTETSPFIPAGQTIINEPLEEDIKQVSISQPTMVLSVTAYGKEFSETSQLAQWAHNWFSFIGYRVLKELGYIIESLGSVDNRDTLLVDEYERRRGFDVTLRFVHTQER